MITKSGFPVISFCNDEWMAFNFYSWTLHEIKFSPKMIISKPFLRDGSFPWPWPRRACCGATSKNLDLESGSWLFAESNTPNLQSDPSGGNPRYRVQPGKELRRRNLTATSALNTCTTSRISGSVSKITIWESWPIW